MSLTYLYQIVIYYSKIIIDHCFILKQTALWKTYIHFNKLTVIIKYIDFLLYKEIPGSQGDKTGSLTYSLA